MIAAAVIEELNARRSHEVDDATSTVPIEALARLDRLASASVLGAGVAHEVANPLGALLGALDAATSRLHELRARGGATPTELDAVVEDLELASTGASLITDIVHDYQLFLRSDAATARPGGDADRAEHSRTDVRVAVERALRIARPLLRAVARVDAPLAAVPAVRAPGSRIAQIVLNLLLNAAEALASRPAEDNVVSVRLEAAPGRVLVEVSDNGPGVSPEIRARLFEVGVSRRRGRASSGLGLAVCRELATRMGGTITVSSREGAGTTFLVSLPADVG